MKVFALNSRQQLEPSELVSAYPWVVKNLEQFAPLELQQRLNALNPNAYGKTRNDLSGAVSGLSPYIEHGLVSSEQVLDYVDHWVQAQGGTRQLAYHFLQQLCWREFFQRKLAQAPEELWQDIQPYKTGLAAHSYAQEMPQDILQARTPDAVINHLVEQLAQTGYLHNHGRLYLAAYIVHWRRVKWQVGARWMLLQLLDGNLASNNFSWQWVASTGANKPYFYNLENVQKFGRGYFTDEQLSEQANPSLVGSYEVLALRLFGTQEVGR